MYTLERTWVIENNGITYLHNGFYNKRLVVTSKTNLLLKELLTKDSELQIFWRCTNKRYLKTKLKMKVGECLGLNYVGLV